MASASNWSTRVGNSRLARSTADLLPCDFCPGQGLNVCKALERERLRELLAMGKRSKWKKGEYLFTAGERANFMFKITRGIVARSQLLPDGRRQIVGFAMGGEICGLPEREGRYILAARAVTEVEACAFGSDRFNAFVDRHPDVAHEQRMALQRDLSFVTERALVLGRLLANEKLAHFIVEFGSACARAGMEVQPLLLPMTRVDIADYLGLTVETVSRTFAELRRENLIRVLEHGVLVLDRRRLEELATVSHRRAMPASVAPRPCTLGKPDAAPLSTAESGRPIMR